MAFIIAAMEYVTESSYTYYIGGSNYQSADNSDVQVTPFRYCASSFSINDPGKKILVSCHFYVTTSIKCVMLLYIQIENSDLLHHHNVLNFCNYYLGSKYDLY